MANVKITELTAATALAGTDVLPIVDVGADATKKVSVSDLLRNLPDGTASAPALAFADDQNTGVLSPGDNSLAFATSGTQRLVIDSSGNVGVGTSSPTGLIHGYINANAQLIFQNSSQNNLYVSGTNATVVVDAIGSSFPGFFVKVNGAPVGQFTCTGTSSLDIASGSTSTPILFKQSSTERARIDSSGRLLLGTTTEGAASVANSGPA